MEKLRKVSRWILLLLLISIGLLYLNSTFYSLWAAGGPPTEVPQAWINRAIVHFGLSIFFILTGVMCFVALKKGFKLKKSKYFLFWVLAVSVALGYPQVREFLKVDSCLDSGGSWDERKFECIK